MPRKKKSGRISMRSKSYDAVHASYFLALHRCPKCNEDVFAAEGATLLPEGIRFEWSCDLCGHRFETDEAVAA
jgi:transcription elongation factor Elf1